MILIWLQLNLDGASVHYYSPPTEALLISAASCSNVYIWRALSVCTETVSAPYLICTDARLKARKACWWKLMINRLQCVFNPHWSNLLLLGFLPEQTFITSICSLYLSLCTKFLCTWTNYITAYCNKSKVNSSTLCYPYNTYIDISYQIIRLIIINPPTPYRQGTVQRTTLGICKDFVHTVKFLHNCLKAVMVILLGLACPKFKKCQTKGSLEQKQNYIFIKTNTLHV